MNRHWHFLPCAALASLGVAQTPTRQNLADILGFENGKPGTFPAGWTGGPAGDIFTDEVVHSGKYSCRIERNASSSGTFSSVATGIPLDFAGTTIEWRGFFKTENVSDYVALWIREDGDTFTEAFSSMQALKLNGTRDWAQYSVTVPNLPAGKQLSFGFLVSGTGKGWVDDLELLVDGKPVAQAPNRTTVLDTDREFDNGSRIALTNLSDTQVRNLAMLARVWGFLKYHHLAVTSGRHHWDYELFRVLPKVLAAGDSAGANSAVSSWIAGLGAVADCATACASLKTDDLYLNTNLDWIGDESLLGSNLSQTLKNIYRNRTPADRQFYVSLAPGVLNPVFADELDYPLIKLPDAGYQLLALFRFWNIVQYFYPNRDVMADGPPNSPGYWNNVLLESIPPIALAKDSLTYRQEVRKRGLRYRRPSQA